MNRIAKYLFARDGSWESAVAGAMLGDSQRENNQGMFGMLPKSPAHPGDMQSDEVMIKALYKEILVLIKELRMNDLDDSEKQEKRKLINLKLTNAFNLYNLIKDEVLTSEQKNKIQQLKSEKQFVPAIKYMIEMFDSNRKRWLELGKNSLSAEQRAERQLRKERREEKERIRQEMLDTVCKYIKAQAINQINSAVVTRVQNIIKYKYRSGHDDYSLYFLLVQAISELAYEYFKQLYSGQATFSSSFRQDVEHYIEGELTNNLINRYKDAINANKKTASNSNFLRRLAAVL